MYNLHLSLVHNVKEDGQKSQSRLNKIKSKNIELKHIGGNIKTNIKEKQSFKCEICERNFSFRFSLKRHIASVHEGKKSLKCDRCDYTSSQRYSMKKHIEIFHEGINTSYLTDSYITFTLKLESGQNFCCNRSIRSSTYGKKNIFEIPPCGSHFLLIHFT